MPRARLLLAIVAASSTAIADDLTLPASAKRHYEAGNKAYLAQDFTTAAKEFSEAYAEVPDPKLLYAWAQAEKYGGHCDKAIELYRRYLQAELTPHQADDARKKIAFCEQQLPAKHPPPPAPPKPPLQAQSQEDPRPVETPPEPHVYRWYADPLGDTLAVAGTVGLVVGVVYIANSSSTASQAGMAADLPTYESQIDDANTQRHIGLASVGLGVALAGASAYVILRHRHDHAAPIVTSDGHSIFIGARF